MRTLSLLFCLVLVTGCASPEPGVHIEDVERIINTLASDDMEGRGSYARGIRKAADFLSDEFDDIGLGMLEGSDSYLQSFELYSLSPGAASVSINGESVEHSSFFPVGSHEEIAWDDPSHVQVAVVGAEDELPVAFREARDATSPTLVLVDPAHRNMFDRYRAFFGGSVRTGVLNAGAPALFVLSGARSVSDLSVSIVREAETVPMANVVGQITGNRTDEFVLFSAHYDHLGIVQPVDGDSIANGANDNASGTTAVVTLARYFADGPKPERTLLFALFTAEESGGYGSRHFSEALDPDQIMAMFNIEMIGKPAVDGPNTAWITGFDRSTFGQILQAAVEGTEYTFYPDPYPDQNLFFRSDNATLARLGVPAHTISTTPIDVDPDYHQVTDEVPTLDLDHLTNTVKAIAAGAVTIVSGEATPTRVTIEE